MADRQSKKAVIVSNDRYKEAREGGNLQGQRSAAHRRQIAKRGISTMERIEGIVCVVRPLLVAIEGALANPKLPEAQFRALSTSAKPLRNIGLSNLKTPDGKN